MTDTISVSARGYRATLDQATGEVVIDNLDTNTCAGRGSWRNISAAFGGGAHDGQIENCPAVLGPESDAVYEALDTALVESLESRAS